MTTLRSTDGGEPELLVEIVPPLLILKINRSFARNAMTKAIAEDIASALDTLDSSPDLGSRPEIGVNGAGRRFCFETYQVIEERTYARACSSIADRPRSRQDRRTVRLRT